MKSKKSIKTYVVRKFIKAYSAIDAIKKEKNFPVDDVWVHKEEINNFDSAIGFEQTQTEEEE